MNNSFKLIGIIALTALIGFSCGGIVDDTTGNIQVPKHSITFMANGATSGTGPGTITVPKHSMIALPDEGDLARTGSTPNFDCWNTKDDGTGENLDPGESFYVDKDTILYARWAANDIGGGFTKPIRVKTYTVTFDAGTGTGTSITVSGITKGNTISMPAKGTDFNGPSLKTNRFLGWSSDGGVVTYQPGNSYTVTTNITFSAQWGRTSIIIGP